ncbi:NYN domain-containing protein, partial [Bacillus cereus]|nr:NYN domain-containing protein [Bacillus cereus]
ATSDQVEQHVAFGQGALRVSARELLIEIEESEREVQKRIQQDSAKLSRNSLDAKLSPELRKLFERWRRE